MKKFPVVVRLIIVVLVICGCAMFLRAFNQVDKPTLVNTQGRTFERATVVEILKDNLQEDGSRVGDQVVSLRVDSGDYAGEILTANSPNGLLFGTVTQPGMKVIMISSRAGQLGVHTVYNVDRTIPIIAYVGIFLLLLCIVGGRKGIKSAIALIFTFICFIFLFFPMILRGIAPVTAALVVSALVLAATLYLINGLTRKTMVAFLSTLGGLAIAGAAALIFGHITNLSGYNVSNIESLIFVAQNTVIDVGQVLFAGILFASLGAVMDIAMDVTSACSELYHHDPSIAPKKLFWAGMNVGRDVMGTMSATLILAFFGGSLGVWVLDYVYDLPFLQLISSNAIGIEIMKGLSGSFGVIFAAPLAAALSAWVIEAHTKK